MQEPPDSLPVERSTGIFDSQSLLFQRTLLITSTLLSTFILLGVIYEIIRRLRARAKIRPDGRFYVAVGVVVFIIVFTYLFYFFVINFYSRLDTEVCGRDQRDGGRF